MKINIRTLAELIHADIDGDSMVELSGFANIQDACEGQLTFLANPKYTEYIYTTKASAVLVERNFVAEHPVSATLLRVDDPYSTLAELLEQIDKMKSQPVGIEDPCHISERVIYGKDVYIGSFSYVGKNVKIGNNVKIYPQVYIGNDAKIGDNTILHSGVKIYEGCIIGNNCVLHSGCVIGADGFGFAPKDGVYEKIPQIGNVVLEDNVEIGANTTVDRATFGTTRIGKGTKIDNLVQVAHNVNIGQNNVFAAQTGIAGSTQIGNGNRVGGQCGFAGHIKIGDNNEFGAQSGIPNNVGDNKRLIGYPAVEARRFAKTQVYLKRLEELFNK